MALTVLAILRHQQDQAGYQSTGSLIKVLTAVTAVHRAGITNDRAGNDLGIAFCRGIMYSLFFGVLLFPPGVDLDIDAVQKIKMA